MTFSPTVAILLGPARTGGSPQPHLLNALRNPGGPFGAAQRLAEQARAVSPIRGGGRQKELDCGLDPLAKRLLVVRVELPGERP
jgi:hypothetical protein